MKLKQCGWAVLVAFLATGIDVSSQILPNLGEAKSEPKSMAQEAWDRFLLEQFKVGNLEQDINKLMAGKFRDQGRAYYGGTGAYGVLFLVDDFHQVTFEFDASSKLTSIPRILKRRPWLRFPDGTIVESGN